MSQTGLLSPNMEATMTDDDDVTQEEAAEVRSVRAWRGLTPAKTITPAGRRVLEAFDGLRLEYVSNVLTYADPLRRAPRRDHKTLLRLVLGGHMRVFRVSGPLPGEHAPSRVGAHSFAHYQLRQAERKRR